MNLIRYQMIALLFSLMMSCSQANANEYAWRIAKNRDGIRVEKRALKDSTLQEVRGVTRVQASLEEVLKIYDRADLWEEWCHQCTEIRLIEQINPDEKIIYYKTDAPWPVSDRDSYSYHTRQVDPKTQAVTYEIRDYSQEYPKTPGLVRVENQNGRWRFTPKDDGTVELYYQQFVDIGGRIPKWVVNKYFTDVPFYTLKNFGNLIIANQNNAELSQ